MMLADATVEGTAICFSESQLACGRDTRRSATASSMKTNNKTAQARACEQHKSKSERERSRACATAWVSNKKLKGHANGKPKWSHFEPKLQWSLTSDSAVLQSAASSIQPTQRKPVLVLPAERDRPDKTHTYTTVKQLQLEGIS